MNHHAERCVAHEDGSRAIGNRNLPSLDRLRERLWALRGHGTATDVSRDSDTPYTYALKQLKGESTIQGNVLLALIAETRRRRPSDALQVLQEEIGHELGLVLSERPTEATRTADVLSAFADTLSAGADTSREIGSALSDDSRIDPEEAVRIVSACDRDIAKSQLLRDAALRLTARSHQ